LYGAFLFSKGALLQSVKDSYVRGMMLCTFCLPDTPLLTYGRTDCSYGDNLVVGISPNVLIDRQRWVFTF